MNNVHKIESLQKGRNALTAEVQSEKIESELKDLTLFPSTFFELVIAQWGEQVTSPPKM